MKIFIALTFLLFNCAIAFAQSDIEQEVRNLPDTPSDIITKARRLLRTEFINGNLLKVQALKDYIMDSLANDTIPGLLDEEVILLDYWTKDFAKILSESAVPIINTYQGCMISAPFFRGEPLLYVLNEKTYIHSDTLFSFIEMSSYSQEDKDFLKLNLRSILFETRPYAYYHDKDFQTRDTLNQFADTFLNQYPDSKYESYVRSNIRLVYGPSETAVAIEMNFGGATYTGELGNRYGTAVVLSYGVEYIHHDVALYGRYSLAASGVKNDMIVNNTIVKKGTTAQLMHLEVGTSYTIFENSLLKITPFAGLGIADIEPSEGSITNYPELKDATIGANLTYNVGVSTDFKLGSIMNDAFYWPLRFRYGYTALDFKSSGISGGMHSITVGIGIFFGGMERQY